MVERSSGKHGARKDDALEKEMEGFLQGSHPTRAEESLDAEPPADDDPEIVRPLPPEQPEQEEQQE